MKFKKKVLLLKLQTAVGTAATPTEGANAILVKDAAINPMEGEALSRNLDKADFGADLATLVGRHVKLSFKVEVAGSGAAGTAPAWGPVMLACSHSETIVATTSVTYAPIDDALPATIWFKQGDVMHKITDCRGSVKLTAGKRQYSYFEFEFIGLYSTPEAHTTTLTPVTSAFVTPVPFRASTVEAEVFGTVVCLTSANFTGGQKNSLWECSEAETVVLEDRQGAFDMKFVEPAIATHNFYSDIEADTAGEISYVHGTAAGNIVEFVAHHAQITNPPSREDDMGQMVLSVGGAMARVGTTEYSIIVR